MTQPQLTEPPHRTNHTSAAFRLWQLVLIAILICLGITSEGLATHVTVSPTSLTYTAVQGTNPPNQTLSINRLQTYAITLTTSDNATWLTVSPATGTMTTSPAKLTVAVKSSGLAAGTYKATITIKVGLWYTGTIPVTLTVSPSSTQPPPPTTSTATLTWNAVTGATISGYKVYVGEAPKLYTKTITLSTVTSASVGGLTVGKTYYFVVKSYNSAGESPPSNEVSKTIK
jgi:hypothetical protein